MGITTVFGNASVQTTTRNALFLCERWGIEAPEHFVYELFLDAEGAKISKSKGNGLSIEEWLTYASPESLGLYMFNKPRAAKRLHFDVIPKAVEDYYAFASAFDRQDAKSRLQNPVFHIHGGEPKTHQAHRAFRRS